MGRGKIDKKLQKNKLSVTITSDKIIKFKELGIKNKSKLINSLLSEFFEEQK